MTRKIISPTKQKVLLLLAGGVALGLTRSPGRYWKLVRALGKEWKFIDRRHLLRLVHEFRHQRLVDYRENPDGTVRIVVSENGKHLVRQFDMDKLTIKSARRWDKHWRLVIFDIPERRRAARVALREKLKELGFLELQKSVLVYPYPCRAEIDFTVEFFELRPYVRLVEAYSITNEADLLRKFRLKK